jgi:hypothetical protein
MDESDLRSVLSTVREFGLHARGRGGAVLPGCPPLWVYEGTSQIQQVIIARQVLGEAAS